MYARLLWSVDMVQGRFLWCYDVAMVYDRLIWWVAKVLWSNARVLWSVAKVLQS